MHELSLVQGLLSQLESLARQHKTSSIRIVRVEIGQFSGIVVDSFQFAFEVLAKESFLMKNAELEIRVPPMQYKCFQCQNVLVVDNEPPAMCSKCQSTLLVPDGGDGVILLQVEMD